MKAFLMAALQTIIKALVGSLNYETIRMWVMEVDASPQLTGSEKRERVVRECASIAQTVGVALLNLAIETIVNSMKVKL
jgi:hypothetical protein